jgi:hypothetical protein
LRSTQIEYGTKAVVSSAFFENDSLLGANESTLPRSKRYRRDDFILSGLFADYHRPFGMHWQADGTTRALVSESGDRVELATVLRGTWIVTDRWLGTGFFNHSASAPGEGWDRTVERWNIEYGASVSYFFEDSWAFTLGAQQQQTHAPDNFLRHEFFSLGVTYQVSGLLNAPGVFEPMRLTPPAR